MVQGTQARVPVGEVRTIMYTEEEGGKVVVHKLPWDASNPAVKSKLSPGKKNPARIPDSAKIMAKIPK